VIKLMSADSAPEFHNSAFYQQPVQQAVVAKINLARKGPQGRKWSPSREAVICNVHYADCKCPSGEDRELLPIKFKRLGYFSTTLPSKKSRHVVYSTQTSIVLESDESLTADCAAGVTGPSQSD